MDGALAAEARALLASAKAWLAELIEEGVDDFPRAQGAQGAQGGEAAAQRATGERSSPEPAAAQRATGERSSPEPEPASQAREAAPAPQLELGVAPGPAPSAERPTLAQVREALGECTRCRLCEGRTQIVFGDGDPQAALMFIGEGPGETEDLRGLPFVGRAGELLTQMIEKGLGIRRRDVYICNIVKCRPPGNRTPLSDEVASCRPFLDGQIDAVQPRVIVALGKPAASLLLGRDVAITRARGTWHAYRGIPVMPTFHPAFVLRQYTEENRRLVWSDLKAALEKSRQ